MRVPITTICLATSLLLFQGCESFEEKKESITEGIYSMTLPDLPQQAYVNTVEYDASHFHPWKPPNPFDYEGNYEGEMGDTGEYLYLEIHGKDEGIHISGKHTVAIAGRGPSVTPIDETELNLFENPFFRAGKSNAFFVTFSDPENDLFPEPVGGVIFGELFLAKELPPPEDDDE